MALDVVREYVTSHGADLWAPGQANKSAPPTGWIGRRINVNGTETVAILPERLKSALKSAGYSLDAVLPGWQEQGFLVKYGKGRNACQPPKQLGEGKPRVYVFAPGTVLSTSDDDD